MARAPLARASTLHTQRLQILLVVVVVALPSGEPSTKYRYGRLTRCVHDHDDQAHDMYIIEECRVSSGSAAIITRPEDILRADWWVLVGPSAHYLKL